MHGSMHTSNLGSVCTSGEVALSVSRQYGTSAEIKDLICWRSTLFPGSESIRSRHKCNEVMIFGETRFECSPKTSSSGLPLQPDLRVDEYSL